MQVSNRNFCKFYKYLPRKHTLKLVSFSESSGASRVCLSPVLDP